MDTIEKTSPGRARLLSHLPERLHHHAYVVKDHEANRRFLEDLLGIPLVATWQAPGPSDSGSCPPMKPPSGQTASLKSWATLAIRHRNP